MAEPKISIDQGGGIALEITPLSSTWPLPGRLRGLRAAEAQVSDATRLYSSYIRPHGPTGDVCTSDLSLEDLIQLEADLRKAATGANDRLLLGLAADPAIEISDGFFSPLGAGLVGGGIPQLMQFPIARFNGIQVPVGSSIRFADPSRWFGPGMESRLFTISIANTKKFFSWDAHAPVGNVQHDFFHVNQKGMFNVFGQSDHAALSGAALIQAKQLRYLKIGGRVFLIAGVIVDTVQMGAAGYQSYKTGSVKPIAAQSIRTAGGWALAWAGAKAGVAVGGLLGVETGPGVVLTAIGGGIVGGLGGYFGADWIADFIYKN